MEIYWTTTSADGIQPKTGINSSMICLSAGMCNESSSQILPCASSASALLGPVHLGTACVGRNASSTPHVQSPRTTFIKKYNDCINSPDSSYSASVSPSPPHQLTFSCSHCHRQAKRRRAARNCLRTWRNLGSCVSVAAASRTRHWPSRSKRRLAPSGSAGPMPASQSAPCRPFPFTSCEEPQGE